VTERISVTQLFREHAPAVANYLRRLGVSDADVDDVVQEVFVVAHRKDGYVEGPARPRTWLFAIAWRVASAHRRATRRRRERLPEHAPTDGRDPEQAAVANQRLHAVQRALDTLPDEHRGVFVMFELEGIPTLEIAEAMGVPIGTIHSRLHTARRRFLEAFERDSETAASRRRAR
jgi:RNA polymerase sigma-70 factor (ECF subfamily)